METPRGRGGFLPALLRESDVWVIIKGVGERRAKGRVLGSLTWKVTA